MMRSCVFLSSVGAAIYALLVVTDEMMPIVPNGTKAEFVARQTRLSAWGPYLPDRSPSKRRLVTPRQLAPPQKNIAFLAAAPVHVKRSRLQAKMTRSARGWCPLSLK
jgi:hypothetical protein